MELRRCTWRADPRSWTSLLDRGADVDMRDLDHGATPAQWAIDEPAVCRRLIERGATPDIFIACTLGDIALADQVLAAHPDALRSRSNHGPHMASRPPGGHMYIYRMGVGMRPLPFASTKGHHKFVEQLLKRTSPTEQLIHATWTGDRARAHELVERHRGLVASLAPDERRAICDAAWNNNREGVALMLEVGFPVDARGDDNGTPLDRAAVRGYADIVECCSRTTHRWMSPTTLAGRRLAARYGARATFAIPKATTLRLSTCWQRSTAS